MARRKLRWSADSLMGKYPTVLLKKDSCYVAMDDLRRMLLDAYEAGYAHASEDAKNPTPQYSTQKQYSERYAKMRDLRAYDVYKMPIRVDLSEGTIEVLQGDLLDRFLDEGGKS